MSRSRRKSPCAGMCGGSRASEKAFKKMTHGISRSIEKRLIAQIGLKDAGDLEVKMPRKSRDAVEPWSGDKDGKQWFGRSRNPEKEKWMRK